MFFYIYLFPQIFHFIRNVSVTNDFYQEYGRTRPELIKNCAEKNKKYYLTIRYQNKNTTEIRNI